MSEYKGRIIVEWPPAGPHTCLAGPLVAVFDADTGRLIPVAKVTVHATAVDLVTADVAVFLTEDGEIAHEPAEIAKAAASVPATFPFLVAEMRVRPS